MTSRSGRYQLGADSGRVVVRTAREGLAASAGHDLTIGLPRWSGEVSMGEDGIPTGLEARIELGALTVLDGTGGLKPLTDRDRREIAATARKVLGTDRSPQAVYTADGFEPDGSGGGTIRGTFTLAGASRPLPLRVRKTGPDRFQATGTVVQTQFGLRPYSGFLGALKVRDAVEISVEVSLPEAAG